jgi:hypothetical protein
MVFIEHNESHQSGLYVCMPRAVYEVALIQLRSIVVAHRVQYSMPAVVRWRHVFHVWLSQNLNGLLRIMERLSKR